MRNWKQLAAIGTVGGGAMMAMLLGGCQEAKSQLPTWPIVQRIPSSTPVPEANGTLIVDPAMQARDWDRSVCYYANGSTVAGPTGFMYEINPREPGWTYSAVEPPLFVVQTIALPVTLAIAPPWKAVTYSGVVEGPTYTAMPVLPPSQNTVVDVEQGVPVPGAQQEPTAAPTTQP